ncbi:hypothetical protein O1611_g5867 [Lasiodiplodia mahajangana]|uniref:Uncharacterized protein n=1 Tax=Lasiodiplodia mahajangana TaxID=1108764 RepID=A0ACC2JK60_9PEZI|nr:hypothetical protein O1611_g5867 [Lasiodiplodia mahajangana]
MTTALAVPTADRTPDRSMIDAVTALGAAGSVVGIISFGIELSKILGIFSQVRSGQEHFEDVIAGIKSTTSVLEEICGFLGREVQNITTGKSLESFSESPFIKVKVTADKCLMIFWRIEIAIAGSEHDGFDAELEGRLNNFNQKLTSYRSGYPITIEPQFTLDPLGLREKFTWAFRASKLEKYDCPGRPTASEARYHIHTSNLRFCLSNSGTRKVKFNGLKGPRRFRFPGPEGRKTAKLRTTPCHGIWARNTASHTIAPDSRPSLKSTDSPTVSGLAGGKQVGNSPPRNRQHDLGHINSSQNAQRPQTLDIGRGKHTSYGGQTATSNHMPNASGPSAQVGSLVDTATGVKGPSLSAVTPGEHGLGEEPTLNPTNMGSGVHQDDKSRVHDEIDSPKQDVSPILHCGGPRVALARLAPRASKTVPLNLGDTTDVETSKRRKEAIAHANNLVANCPRLSPVHQQLSTTTDDEFATGHPLVGERERAREDEPVRKIQHFENQINQRHEIEKGIEKEIEQRGLEPRDEADRKDWKRLRTQTSLDSTRQPYERKIIEYERVAEPEYDSRVIDTRRHLHGTLGGGSPRNRGGPMLRSAQPLLEWTPAHMNNGDGLNNTIYLTNGEGDSSSETGSEEYVMAKEFQVLEPSPTLRQEQAEGTPSVAKVDVGQREFKNQGEGVNEAANNTLSPTMNRPRDSQDSLQQDEGATAQKDLISRG